MVIVAMQICDSDMERAGPLSFLQSTLKRSSSSVVMPHTRPAQAKLADLLRDASAQDISSADLTAGNFKLGPHLRTLVVSVPQPDSNKLRELNDAVSPPPKSTRLLVCFPRPLFP